MSKITLNHSKPSSEKCPANGAEGKEPPSTTGGEKGVTPAEPKLFPQVLAAVAACWINVGTGAGLGYATPALPKLQHPSSAVELSDQEASWMASLLMLGALCGALLAGPCVALGRRAALWLCAAPLVGAWAALAAASGPATLCVAHAVLGCCLGIAADAAQLYVGEAAHARWRGALGCVPVLAFNCGVLCSYAAGALLEWDELALFGCALSLPALVLPALLPESPAFLASRGREADALAALSRLRGPDYDATAECEELRACEGAGGGCCARMRSLRTAGAMRPLLLTCAVRMLSRLCGLRAILCYAQAIFASAQGAVNVELSVVATGAVQLFATLLACALLDRLGRRRLLIASQCVMGACLATLGLYLYLFGSNDGADVEWPGTGAGADAGAVGRWGWLPVACVLVYIAANAVGLGPVSGLLLGELVPQRQRSIASSVAGAVSWACAFAVTKTFLDLRACLWLHGAVWAYGAACLAGAAFVYVALPETRALTQLQIELLFRRKDGAARPEVLADVVVVQAPPTPDKAPGEAAPLSNSAAHT